MDMFCGAPKKIVKNSLENKFSTGTYNSWPKKHIHDKKKYHRYGISMFSGVIYTAETWTGYRKPDTEN
jgi:hypothetical protein